MSGYRTMYVDSKRVPIVYSIREEKIEVEVIAIGKRDDCEAYRIASDRLSPMAKDNSHEV